MLYYKMKIPNQLFKGKSGTREIILIFYYLSIKLID